MGSQAFGVYVGSVLTGTGSSERTELALLERDSRRSSIASVVWAGLLVEGIVSIWQEKF
jgi:hypothetical protein